MKKTQKKSTKKMIIDFTIENYRSIKKPITLSAVASRHKSNKSDDKISKPFLFSERNLEILPVLGIFGANASGKSNVISALAELLHLLFYGTLDSGLSNYTNSQSPFLLESSYSKKPTNFTLRVIRSGNIYIYFLSIFKKQVIQERLEYIPSESKRAVTRLLFDRKWIAESKKYVVENGKYFGEKFKEIENNLNESQVFLQLFVRTLSHEVLKDFTTWLKLYWQSIHLKKDYFDFNMSCHILKKIQPNLLKKVSRLMKQFDTGIEDIEIKVTIIEGQDMPKYEVLIVHKTDKGTIKWLLEEESYGTQKLFILATRLLFSFNVRGFVLVDEFGSSTHPLINLEIIKLFQSKKFNKSGAQIIFASHDTNLQKKGVLRRDQIWFAQKLPDGSTDLYSLCDFGERSDLAVDKAYLDGRFGAIPFSPNENELEDLVEVG